MFAQIDTMRMAQALGRHATDRQRVIATNVANADTPGYRARDLRSFDPDGGAEVTLRATRPAHVAAGAWGSAQATAVEVGGEPSPNGNTVSLEEEMVRAADAKRQFDLSLTVTQSGMSLIRTALGRRG